MEKSNSYEQEFAEAYDELMSGTKYDRWQSLIYDQIKVHNIPMGKALDIACGTGTISKMLLDKGFSVTGLDMSKSMIEQARKKLGSYGDRMEYVQADMSNFSLPQDYDLAVSFYDSINYVLDPDAVQRMMKNVYNSLKTGGYFIFDMNTVEHVRISQKTPERNFKLKDNSPAVFRFSGKDDYWILDIELTKNGRVHKERHIERGYTADEIKPIILEAGFSFINILDEYKKYWDGKEHLSRQYYVVRKDL